MMHFVWELTSLKKSKVKCLAVVVQLLLDVYILILVIFPTVSWQRQRDFILILFEYRRMQNENIEILWMTGEVNPQRLDK